MDFESYVRESRTSLLRFAIVVTHDGELAQDVVQDVLLRAQKHWPRITSVDQPHAYVCRMVANEVVSWRRKWSRIEARPDTDLDTAVADPTDAVDRRNALVREIARLPIRQRAAITLRYLEDMDIDEIAQLLGCAPTTVRVHIHRGLARLRVEFADAPTPAAEQTRA